MKPENREIRRLEKQLETASPEVVVAIDRVVAALTAMLYAKEKNDPEAMAFAKAGLKIETDALEKLTAKP